VTAAISAAQALTITADVAGQAFISSVAVVTDVTTIDATIADVATTPNDVDALEVSDFIITVDMSAGSDSIDVSQIDSIVHVEYDARTDSTLGARDEITGFDFNSDVLDFRDFGFSESSLDADADGDLDYHELLDVQVPVSVDNAATLTDFFSVTRDFDDADVDNDITTGTETQDVLFILQNEATTANYRLFVDVNQDGNFTEADDMVIDFIAEVAGDPANLGVAEDEIWDLLDGTNDNALTGNVAADLFLIA